MKFCVLFLALLQSLCCLGFPVPDPELASMSAKGLRVSLAEVNNLYADSHQYRATRGFVTQVIPLGQNNYDMLMTFSIKKTTCLKTSGEDPMKCPFQLRFSEGSFKCSSRVRVLGQSTEVVSLRCGHDSSSSEESSEEIFSRGRQRFTIPLTVSRGSAPASPDAMVAAAPSTEFERSPTIRKQPAGLRTRGDGFNNYLE